MLAWRSLTAELRADGIPDATEEYLIYQTLLGAWPISAERLGGYLRRRCARRKRTRAGPRPTSTTRRARSTFATALLTYRPFLDDFEPFVERVAVEGRRAALAQLLLKLTVPGVPDVYQGDELESLNLVDPDNRRPVDWELRRRLLGELRGGAAVTDETRKLDLIVRALSLRARRADSFTGGAYLPLEAGPGVCAFARGDDVIVVAGVRDWDDAQLALPSALHGSWRSALADRGGFALDAETPGRRPRRRARPRAARTRRLTPTRDRSDTD